MKCRKDIIGKKIWTDNNNLYNTRPENVEILLYRDGELYKTATVSSHDDGIFKFLCLIIWKNASEKYIYRVDESVTPIGYRKIINGNNIINVLENIRINGIKTWADNFNEEGNRPQEITLRLLQNSVEIHSQLLTSPPDTESSVPFDLGEFPFADEKGVPFVYTITEDPVEHYEPIFDGFNITNEYHSPITPFVFTKSNARTGMSLQGGEFEILKNGVVQSTAVSDENGKVTFAISGTGMFSLQETQPPAGFMDNTTVFNVEVKEDGSITVDGEPADNFVIENQPTEYDMTVSRASLTVEEYMAVPNSWPLHGEGEENLCITDKLFITLEITPDLVKWDYGTHDVIYFSQGGGIDITDSYTDGIELSKNDNYTVYARFSNGFETAYAININNIRDGSENLPWLLLNFDTAAALEQVLPGTGQFTLDFMQENSLRLSQHFEIFEDIEMDGREWMPLGASYSQTFKGSLFGNSHDIKNLQLEYSIGNYIGFVSHLADGGAIESLGLINCNVESADYRAAGFVGYVTVNNAKTTILRDLRFSGSVTSGVGAAGIAASVTSTNGIVEIDGCSVNAELSANESFGGIIQAFSVNSDNGVLKVTNCSTSGSGTVDTVSGSVSGGIVGTGAIAGRGVLKIENCINGMTVFSSIVGGIVGRASSTFGAKISACCNRGDVTGVTRVGGIAGFLASSTQSDPMIIENCYNSGKIIANCANITYTGGLIGVCEWFVNITNSYSVGDIVGDGTCPVLNVGGISGNYGVVSNCAAIKALCSNALSDVARISASTNMADQSEFINNIAFEDMQVLINGTQKSPLDIGPNASDGQNVTAAQIKTQSLYETDLGWDFDNVWIFGNDEYTLPVLRSIPFNLQPSILPSHL